MKNKIEAIIREEINGIGAQEALDYGFVDKLVTTPDTIGNNQQGE